MDNGMGRRHKSGNGPDLLARTLRIIIKFLEFAAAGIYPDRQAVVEDEQFTAFRQGDQISKLWMAMLSAATAGHGKVRKITDLTLVIGIYQRRQGGRMDDIHQ